MEAASVGLLQDLELVAQRSSLGVTSAWANDLLDCGYLPEEIDTWEDFVQTTATHPPQGEWESWEFFPSITRERRRKPPEWNPKPTVQERFAASATTELDALMIANLERRFRL